MNKLVTIALLLAVTSFAAQWDVIVSRSRDAQSVDMSLVQTNLPQITVVTLNGKVVKTDTQMVFGAFYILTTNFSYTVSAQIPRRPNATFVDWQNEWVFTDLGSRKPGWGMVSNRVARWAYRLLDSKGVNTNTATLNIYKGKFEVAP